MPAFPSGPGSAPPPPMSAADELIYLIGHDLRASTRALTELPTWIADDITGLGLDLPESTQEMLHLLGVHAQRLDNMTSDLLDFSRIGRKQVRAEINWQSLLDQLLDECPLPTGFALECDLAAPGAFMGPADASRILRHLIGNAVKHHDLAEGRVTLRTRSDGGFCLLSVSDDGPGIPEHLRAKASKMLTTLKPRDEVEGSGMGLATVRRIAETYGGSFDWIDTPERRGLTVQVSLPLLPPK